MKITVKGKKTDAEKAIIEMAEHFSRNLVKRTYRITLAQDKKVKATAKKGKKWSESQIIRNLIDIHL